MTFLGLERPVEQGREQVFDPVTAQMVLNANRDYINAVYNEYQQAKQDMKEFNKEYGDFLSPIAADMDWYAKNVTGAVRDKINDLYARGIDPLRSSEGRAAISMFLNSIDTAGIAKVRQSAEAAKEYIKNRGALQAKGLWNPDYERAVLGGKSIEDWDTIGGNSVWTRTSPSEYQDLNQYTSHIFDNLKDSYIDTRGAYDYYGVTENDLYKSLTPDKLGGLLNTDLGRFHYNNAIRDLVAQGNLNPTEVQKMEQFRKNIVSANHERVHEDRKINEIWKLQQEDASRMRAARASRPAPTQQNNQWSFAELVRRSGTSAILGAQVQEYNDSMLDKQRDAQIEFGKQVMHATGSRSYKDQGMAMYKQKYGQNVYRKQDVMNYLISMGYKPTSDGQSVIIPKSDLGKFNSLQSLASSTTGYRSRKIGVSLQDLKDADVIVYTPSGGSYQAFMKNSRNEAHFEGSVKAVKYKRENGQYQLDKNGNPQVDMDNVKSRTLYFDSDIKSVKNDYRLGSLNAPKGSRIVNTQDSRYQNAINADKETTDNIIKGTIYGSDAILSEEPYYAQ